MSDPDPIDLSQLRMVPDWMKGDKKKPDLAKEYPSEDRGRPRDDKRGKGGGKGGGPRGKGGGQRGGGDGQRGRDSYGDRNRGPHGNRAIYNS